MRIKTFLYSVGLACWISVPIVHCACASWEKPKNELIEYQEFKQTQQNAALRIREIAEAEKNRFINQQELITAEIERQEQIVNVAQHTLDIYKVNVPQDIELYCEKAGAEFNVCPELLEAIAWRESRFCEDAENQGCSGLMQISVKWHKNRMVDLGVKDIYDAEGNIRVGANYLQELLSKYDGDVDLALKEYNGDTSKGVSNYVVEILEVSAALERVHGK